MYTFDSRVRYSEAGPDGRLTVESVINYFQDCSTFQSEDLGVGLKYLKENNIAWLVNYWQIVVNRYPAIGEKIRVGTSPYGFKNFMGFRNFVMETQDGERLVQADSVWTLFDLTKQFPTRVTQKMSERYEVSPRLEMEHFSRKIRLPKEGGIPKDPVRVQEYNLDTNHHMNNGQYVRLAQALLPEDREIRQLRIEYVRQAVLGDVIIPVTYGTGDGAETVIIALKGEDGKPFATVEVRYDQDR